MFYFMLMQFSRNLTLFLVGIKLHDIFRDPPLPHVRLGEIRLDPFPPEHLT